MRASLLQFIKSRYNGLYILFEDRCKCYLMHTLVTRRVIYMTLPMFPDKNGINDQKENNKISLHVFIENLKLSLHM